MKTYLLGDIHGTIDFQSIYRYGKHPEDRLIQLGDFGLVFAMQASADEKRLISEIQQFWGEVLFVDGNHENFDRLAKFPVVYRYGGRMRQIAPRIFQLMRGEVYDIGGETFFVMGGGDSIDKLRRVEGISWWREEQPSYDELENGLDNLEIENWKVDYVLSHTCPMKTKEELLRHMRLVPNSDHLETYLEEVRQKLQYKKWYFGHFHIDVTLNYDMVCLYHCLVQLGEEVPEEEDDFKTGIYSANQRVALEEALPRTHGEVLQQMKEDYYRHHQTKVISRETYERSTGVNLDSRDKDK